MTAPYELSDDSVVVIIGSGAGGGTLGNELAQKGIDTVILEAGPRHEIADFENDEWPMFVKTAWLDNRTTSGDWRVSRDFPNLPAWIVKAVGGSTVHWAGASLRFQEHEFKVRTHYGEVAGANLLDWPIDLAELEPYYAKAETKMGVTGTNGIPRLPGNNNYKVFAKGAERLGYKNVHTGNMSINSKPRDGRGSCQQIGFCFQGCLSGAKWSTLYTEIPKGEATGHLEVRPQSQVLQIEHDDTGKVTGVVYADASGTQQRQKARAVAVAGNSIESPRLLLNSASALFPDGLANSSGQVGTQLHAPHDRERLCDLRSSRSTCIAARPWPGSSRTSRSTIRRAASSAAMKWRPWRSACRSWPRSSIPAPGAGTSPARSTAYDHMAGMWLVGEDMPQESNAVTLHRPI